MEIAQPRWASWSFLLYAGGLTVLAAAVSALSFLASSYGDAAFAAWALGVWLVLRAIATTALSRGERIVAGVFAFASVVAFGVFVGALWAWFGWLSKPLHEHAFRGFHPAKLALELLVIAAAVAAARRFRFPLLVLAVCAATWFFVTDLVSGGGNWTAVVSLVLGLAFLLVGVTIDRGPRRPYGFWVHVVAGAAMGGSLVFFWHHGNWKWALIAVASLVYLRLAGSTGRSSWAVFGAAGLLAAAGHFASHWMHRSLFFAEDSSLARAWVPSLVFTVTGFLLVALGLLLGRRRA